jgi:hypothetical protein
MKMFFTRVRDGLRRRFGEHLSTVDWIAWRDRQLSDNRRRQLETHLKACTLCWLESQRLEDALALFSEADAINRQWTPPISEGLANLQKRIQVWRRSQAGTFSKSFRPVDTKVRLQRVTSELEVYLGTRMTIRLIEAACQSSEEVRNILTTARPLLTGLMGEQAAFNVTSLLFKIFAPETRFV